MVRGKRKYIIYSVILLLVVSLSVGFSAFQKQLLIDDSIFNVRLQEDTRVSASVIQKTSGDAVSNSEDYNVSKIYGNVTFPTTSSYVLYKVDLTNYGNVKTGLLNITSNTSGVNYQICNSSGSNCSNDPKTAVCSGSNCTLGSTKTIYVKVTSTSAGTKNIDLDLEFEPYHTITYYYFNENTSSFQSEIMENDTYEVTLTSDVEEVEVSGTALVNYNKNNHKLTISNVSTDITISAKYKLTDIAETSYSGTNPNNYVRFNDTLFRIITKETVDDGYGNEELRGKIIANTSIGGNKFDNTSNDFGVSSLAEMLNTTYYESLTEDAKELIDTTLWTEDYVDYIGIINGGDYTANPGWIKYQYTLTKGTGNTIMTVTTSGLVESQISYNRDTYPVVYLKDNVLIVGGDGTSTSPYILELPGAGGCKQPNPTKITGKTLTVTGSNQELITVSNQLGTPYYAVGTQLNSSNYSSSGSTTIPKRSAVGTYTVYYYIPEITENGCGIKAKAGSVRATIGGITYTVNYTKGENVSSIGKTTDSCTTSGSSLSCNVTLPTITPSAGYENGKWSDGTNNYNPGASYTLNASNNGRTLTAGVSGRTYVATFNKNGADSIGQTSLSCTVNSGSTCNITLPSITRSGYTVHGWSDNQNSHTGVTGSITLSESKTYYAITSKDITITFNKNGNTSQTVNGGSASTANTVTDSCTMWNTDSNCSVTSPTITAPSGFTVLGYSDTVSSTDITWNQNTAKNVNANKTYYAQSSQELTATFYYNSSILCRGWSTNGADTPETSKCTLTNGATSCTVTIPSIVTSSHGERNSRYKGVSTSTGSMESSSLEISTNTAFYAYYGETVTIYRPTSESAVSSITAYRNEFFNSNGEIQTVISTSNTGITNMTSISGLWSSATLAGFSTSANTTSGDSNSSNGTYILSTIDALARDCGNTYYAIGTYGANVTATFYYSKAADGTVESITASGTQTRNVYCASTTEATTSLKSEGTITAPSLTGEISPTGTTALTGFATANTNMSTTTTYNTETTKYYRVYRNTVTVYKPSSTSACNTTDTVFYRNSYINTANPTVNTTKYTTVLSNSNTSTSDNASYTSGVSGYSLAGFANARNTNTITYANIAALKASSATSAYAVLSKTDSENATFYYSNSAAGAKTSTTVSGTKTTYLTCTTSNTVAGTNEVHGSCTVPTTLTGETTPYSTTSIGWATGSNTMSASTTPTCTTGNSYYKVYRTNDVKLYYPSSTSAANNTNTYRNSYYGTDTNYTVVLGSTNTATGNVSNSTVPSGYTFAGYATSRSSNTVTYSNVDAVAKSTSTAVYAVGTKNVTPTFYYSKGTDGTQASVSGTSAIQYVRCTSTTAAGLSNSNFSIPTLTGETAPTGTTSIGWSSSASSMSTATPDTSSTSWYKVYRSTVTVYKPRSTTACNTTNTVFYRNAYYGTGTNYTTVLSNSNTGTSDNASYTSGVSGYSLAGFANARNTNTITYANIAALKASSATSAYAVLSKTDSENATFYYSNSAAGAKTSTTASGTKTTYLTCTTSNTAAGTNEVHGSCTVPSSLTGETAPTGTTSIGWATGASTMSASTTPTCTTGTSYYKAYRNTVTVYKPSSTSACNTTNTVFYRNAYYGTGTNYTTVLSNSNTGTSDNASYTSGVSGYSLAGFANARNTNTITYLDLTALKASSATSAYAVLSKTDSENATFYYSNSAAGAKTSTTASGTKTTYLTCTTSNTAAGTNEVHGSCTVPTSLTGETAPTGTTSIGWATGNASSLNVSTTPTCTTGTSYYKAYRNTVTVYKPSSTTACNTTNTVFYRNAYYGTGTNYTTVLSTTNTGTSDNASYTSGVSGYSLAGFANARNTNTITYANIAALKASSATSAYAVLSKTDSENATFYYSNSAAGAKTSTTVSGTKTTYLTCTTSNTAAGTNEVHGSCTVPTSLTGETAPTGTTSIGWATGASTMSASTTPTCTAGNSYYKVYRNQLTIYRPTSASAASSTTAYRNAYYGTGANYTVKISTTNTGTTDMTAVSGLWSSLTFAGYATSSNTSTVASGLTTVADSIRAHSSTTYYTIGDYAENVTFKYNSNTTCGGATIATTTSSVTGKGYCTSNSAATISHGTTTTVPSAVSSSKGQYNSAYRAMAAVNSLTSVTTFSGGSTYYAVYSSAVTIHRPTDETVVEETTRYRNEYLASDSATTYTARIAITKGHSTNITDIGLWSELTFYGYSASPNTATRSYDTVAESIATDSSCNTTYYAIGNYEENVTFKYNSNTTCGSATVTTTTSSVTGRVFCMNTMAAGISHGSTTTVPNAVSSSKGQYNSDYRAIAYVDSLTPVTTFTGGSTYYAVYSSAVTIYRPTSASAVSSTTAYRNEYLTSSSASTYTSRIATSNNSSSNMTSISGLWSGVTFVGYSTSANTTTPDSGLTTIASIANKCDTTYYVIGTYTASVTGTFYYSNSADGAKTSKTGTGTQTRNIYCSSTTAATTSVKTEGNYTIPTLTGETAPTGTSSIGWAINNASTMSTGTPTTVNTSFYRVYRNMVVIDKPVSESACDTSNTEFYRNAFYGSSTNYTKVLSTTNTGTTENASYSPGVSGYTLRGFANNTSSTTITYADISAIRNSNASTVYAVLGKDDSVSATFYYSTAADGTMGSTTASGTQITYLRCTSTPVAGTTVTNGTITPTITDEVVPAGTAVVGWTSAINTMSTGTPTTSKDIYYRIYRQAITIYRPTSQTEVGALQAYRNAYSNTTTPTVGTTKFAIRIATSSTSRTDITTSTLGLWSDATFAGYSTSVNTATVTSGLTTVANSIKSHSGTTYYAIGSYGVSKTGTFYYSNSAAGAKTSTTGTGTQTRNIYCSSTTAAANSLKSEGNYTIPTLTGEVAPTGTASVGWAINNASTMGTGTPTTANTAFYKVYRNQITIYRPTSASAASSTTAYRNAYYGTETNYTVKIATTNTGTTDMTAVSGLWSSLTFAGYATSSNTSTVASGLTTVADSIRAHSSTTYYTIGNYAENVTFKYNSNTTCGGATIATTTSGVTGKGYCTSNSAATTTHGTTTTVPSAVSSSKGQYNSAYRAMAAVNSLTAVTTFSGGSTYYAVYSSAVTNYYYSSSYTSRTLYRNEYLASTTATSYTARIATANTGTSNYSTAAGPNSSTWYGLADTDTATRKYSSVAAAATSDTCTTNLYSIYQYTINYSKGANVSEIGATSGSCRLDHGSTSCSVTLPTITANTGYTPAGWSTTNGATTGTAAGSSYSITTNATVPTLYANANIANYLEYNGSTLVTGYSTLQSALSGVTSGNTIKVMANTTETSTSTLASSKTGIKLDLNGKTVTMNSSFIDNKGTLDIYNSSSSEGKIVGSNSNVIRNQGTLTLNGTSSSNVIKIDKNFETNNYGAIYNMASSNLTVNNNVNITVSVTDNSAGIYNEGVLTLNGGSISGERGIYNGSSGSVTISGSSVSITGTGSGTGGINNQGTVTMTSGTITGTYGISNSSGATATITGGSVIGTTAGISNSSGTITLGTNDSTVSTTSPIIKGTSDYISNGITTSGGTFNFYDGVINSSRGVAYSIDGTVSNTPTGYSVYKSVTSGNAILIANPATPTISGGGTSVYGNTRTLTCVTSTTYETGINKYYSFGYSTTDGGEPDNWTTASTTATYSAPSTYSTRYYSCKVYAGSPTSQTPAVASSTASDAQVTYVNARIDFDATTNGGTISGPTPAYAAYNNNYLVYNRTNGSSLANVSATKSGYTFDGWFTAASGGTKVINSDGTLVASVSNWTNANGKFILTNTSNTANTYKLYAQFTGNIVTATFYYNSNTTCGSLTVATATASCTISSGTTCTVTVPSVVSNSKGQYNSAYKGVRTGTSSMAASSSLEISADTTYYANYSSALTIFRPTSASAASSTTAYRNEYFTSTTAMGRVVSTANSNTTAMTAVSGLWSSLTFYGYATSSNTATRAYSTVAASIATDSSCNTTYYTIGNYAENVTFKYNNNTTCGTATVTTTTSSVTGKGYCTSNSAATTTHGTTTTVPSAVSSSKGQYNSAYRAMAAVNSLTAVTTFSGGSTYYAVYSSAVTNYYYSSSYTSRTLYRNEYLASATATSYTARIATADTGTSNYSTAAGPNSSTWYGLADTDTATRKYSSVAAAATSDTCTTNLYSIYQYTINYSKGANVSAIGATSGSCRLDHGSTSCSVTLPTITANTGYTSVGWSTTNGATTGTAAGNSYSITTNATVPTLYANAKGNSYTVSFNGIGIQNMNSWIKNYSDRFSITYNSSTNKNSITMTGGSGWELLYLKVPTAANTAYHFTFDYKIVTAYNPLNSSYSGIGVQALNTVADNDNIANGVKTQYLPTTANATGSFDLSFTATTATTLTCFNFGMAADGVTISIEISNMRLVLSTKSVTYGSTYGSLPTHTLSGFTFEGWYTGQSMSGTKITSSSTVSTASNHDLYIGWTYNPSVNKSGTITVTSGGFHDGGVLYPVYLYLDYNLTGGTGYNITGNATLRARTPAYNEGVWIDCYVYGTFYLGNKSKSVSGLVNCNGTWQTWSNQTYGSGASLAWSWANGGNLSYNSLGYDGSGTISFSSSKSASSGNDLMSKSIDENVTQMSQNVTQMSQSVAEAGDEIKRRLDEIANGD